MRKWTEKERKRQACIARRKRPWKASTGPKTVQGKERSKMNAWKTGTYTEDWQFLRMMFLMNRKFVANAHLWYAAMERQKKLETLLRERTEKE
jgi:hypothetical protein